MNSKYLLAAIGFVLLMSAETRAQDNNYIRTVFNEHRGSGGYGALTNKFTAIDGEFANLVGIYGGWYVNHCFLIGVGASAATNNIPVPIEYRVDPLRNMSYMYGQVGAITEYVVGSNNKVHVVFNLFTGAGFTTQYERYDWHDNDFDLDHEHAENWFFVAEPGVQVELNLSRWMRFSPGISYRAAFNSDAPGLSDNALSDLSYNLTLKFGKF
jgi:hypothetical protein